MSLHSEPFDAGSDLKLAFRPSGEQAWRSTRRLFASTGFVLTAAALNIYVLVHYSFQGSPRGISVVVAIMAGGALLFALLRALYMHYSRLTLDDQELIYRSPFSLTKRYPRKAIRGVATRIVRWRSARAPQELHIIYGNNEAGLFTLPAAFWNPRDIESLAHALGAPGVGKPKEVTASELQHEYPHVLTFAQRNGATIGMLLALAVLTLIVIILGQFH